MEAIWSVVGKVDSSDGPVLYILSIENYELGEVLLAIIQLRYHPAFILFPAPHPDHVVGTNNTSILLSSL